MEQQEFKLNNASQPNIDELNQSIFTQLQINKIKNRFATVKELADYLYIQYQTNYTVDLDTTAKSNHSKVLKSLFQPFAVRNADQDCKILLDHLQSYNFKNTQQSSQKSRDILTNIIRPALIKIIYGIIEDHND